MEIIIRKAREEDVDFLAWAILTASRSHLARGTWEYIYSSDPEWIDDFLAILSMTDPVHWCHWERFFVAEDPQGEVLGALSAFDPNVHGQQVLASIAPMVASECGMNEGELIASLSRGQTVRSVIPEYMSSHWVIENVACRPEARGKGIAARLISEALAEGKALGFTQAQVSFFLGNTSAEKLYERLGFVRDEEKRSEEFENIFGSPGMVRLVKGV